MGQRNATAVRAVTAAAALASIAHVGILIPRYIIRDPAVPVTLQLAVGSIVVTVVAALAGSILALVLVVRSWERPGARSLALFLAAVSTLWGSVLRFVAVRVEGQALTIGIEATTRLEILLLPTAILVAAASFLRFSALFPVPLEASALPVPHFLPRLRAIRVALLRGPVVWWTALAAIAVAVGWGVYGARVAAWLATGSPDGQALLANASLRGAWVTATAVLAILTLLVIPALAMVLGVRNLLASYRSTAREERRRVSWLIAGAAIASWMMLVPLVALPLVIATGISADWLPFVIGLCWVLAPAILVGAAAVAVFYSGAVDPALVLQRSTIYGILGAIAFLVFTTLESALSTLFESRLGVPGLIGSVAAGVIAAGFMVPVRHGLRRITSRAATDSSATTAADESIAMASRPPGT